MKINRACILALSAFFVVSEGSEASDDIPNLRRELGVPFYFKVLDCNKDMVDVEVCFRTDEWPGESVVSIEDEDDEIGFEFGPFTKKEKVYCEEDRFCPGKYWLTITDSVGDGTNSNYGEITIRADGEKLLDKTLSDFGWKYGPRKFIVPEKGGHSTNTPNNNNNNNNNVGSGPFGCCGSGKSCCRCCKDECAKRNKGDLDDIKDCKTNRCRAHYGKSTCKD